MICGRHQHTLAFFATGARTADELEAFWATDHQGSASDRVQNLAVFHPIGHAGREHKLATGIEFNALLWAACRAMV